MSERPNNASICSVVFLDIPDQLSKPGSKQIQDKALFNSIINEAIRDVAPDDRILVDMSDGVVMALPGAPERAIFIAMMIRDAIVQHNKAGDDKLFIRAGISMGPVQAGGDTNGLSSIEGDGVNAAERVKNLAGPNQILVSRTYYEITSGLTDEIAGMFSRFEGEQEVYAIRSSEEQPFVAESAVEPAAASLFSRLLNNEDSPRYGLWGSVALVAIVILVSGFMLISSMRHPDLGAVIADSQPAAPVIDSHTVSAPIAPQPVAPITHEAAPNLQPANPEPIVTTVAIQPTAVPPVATQPAATPPVTTPPAATTATADTRTDASDSDSIADNEVAEPEMQIAVPQQEEKVAAVPPVRRGPAVEERKLPTTGVRPKTIWDEFRKSFKQGREEHICTQAEIALNQCK